VCKYLKGTAVAYSLGTVPISVYIENKIPKIRAIIITVLPNKTSFFSLSSSEWKQFPRLTYHTHLKQNEQKLLHRVACYPSLSSIATSRQRQAAGVRAKLDTCISEAIGRDTGCSKNLRIFAAFLISSM
jgi:hypothetical protein